jgi:hypothetical protein
MIHQQQYLLFHGRKVLFIYYCHGKYVLKYVRAAERQLTLGNKKFGEIPLVMNTQGVVLSHVKDCLDFQKDLARIMKGTKRRVDNSTTRRDIRPLPSRVRRRSPNPRPSKRPREETWQGDNDDGQDFTDDFGFSNMDMECSVPTGQLYTIDSASEDAGSVDANTYGTFKTLIVTV